MVVIGSAPIEVLLLPQIVLSGPAFTIKVVSVTILCADEVQPLFVTVTVYVPAVVILFAAVTAPLFHA